MGKTLRFQRYSIINDPFSYPIYLLSCCNCHCLLILFLHQDSEGLIVLNIGSYMGGVDLWQNDNEHDDDFHLQTMHDKLLEVVCVCGAWHLGKLQV